MRSILFGAVGAALLLSIGCSSSDDNNGSGGGGGSNGETCLTEAQVNFVVPLRKDDGGGNFLSYQSSTDGSSIFFSTIESVWKLDPASKGLTKLVTKGIAPRNFPHGNDIVVIDGKTITTIPKTGGAETTLPPLTRFPSSSLAGTAEVDLDGDTLYALEQTTGTVFKHDLASGTETDLGTEKRSETSSLRFGKDFIFSYYSSDPDTTNAPTTVWKLAKTGGAITPIALPTAPSQVNYPVGVAGADLVVLSADTSAFKGHILRVTPDGATTEIGVIDYVIGFKGQAFTTPAQGGTFIKIIDDTFFLADGAATATKLPCMTGLSQYGVAAIGKTAYVSVVNESSMGGVIAVALP